MIYYSVTKDTTSAVGYTSLLFFILSVTKATLYMKTVSISFNEWCRTRENIRHKNHYTTVHEALLSLYETSSGTVHRKNLTTRIILINNRGLNNWMWTNSEKLLNSNMQNGYQKNVETRIPAPMKSTNTTNSTNSNILAHPRPIAKAKHTDDTAKNIFELVSCYSSNVILITLNLNCIVYNIRIEASMNLLYY